MKNENQIGGTTRRSFVKKSVIAAVAASNLTIFSGLVNAAVYDLDGGIYSGTQGHLCSIFNHRCWEHQLYPNSAIFWACDCYDEVTQQVIPNGAGCDDADGTNARCR